MHDCTEDSNLFETFLIVRNSVCVLNNFIPEWAPMKWTIDSLAQHMLGQTVSVKIGSPYKGGCIPKESDCSTEKWDLGELCNYLTTYHNEELFYYAGYAHLINLNTLNKSFFTFDWGWAGLSHITSEKSTLWIGSKGSFTPCHKDSYGCNLHAQITGSKEWLLWPPDCELGPTRIPYEESSIFSDLDVLQKPLKDKALRVVIHPGQVLFIPKHWWHLATNLETSASVNTWIELECDSADRLKESITRLLVCTMKTNETDDEWLNPGEELSTYNENVSLLKNSLSLIKGRTLREVQSDTTNYFIAEKKAGVGIKVDTIPLPVSLINSKRKRCPKEKPVNIVDALLNTIVADDCILNLVTNRFLESVSDKCH